MNSSSEDQRIRNKRGKNVPTQPDLEALASFRHALRQFLATADVELERHGLGPRRYQAMLAIQAHRTEAHISVGELAELLLIRHNTAAELVKRLEQAGLVRKWYDPADRRRALLGLSEDGQAKLGEIATAQLQRLHESRAALMAIFGLPTSGERSP
jgi:DNA-binding MarR family transcriptional regulator